MITSGSVRFHEDLEKLFVPIDSVQPHPINYNNGDVDEIAVSIEVSGMYRPVYVRAETSEIIAGNHTWMACKRLDAEVIPVVMLDVDAETALRIMVEDNESAKKAYPDYGQLESILQVLAATEDGLLGTSTTLADLERIHALNQIPADLDEGDILSWPLLTFRVPPHIKSAFLAMTDIAGGDRERFEMLLRLAGWEK